MIFIYDLRDWRPGKRLRPDSRELKANNEKAEAAPETAPEDDTPSWIRSSPADLYFTRNANGFLSATQKMKELEDIFEEEIVKRAQKVRSSMPDADSPAQSSRECGHHHLHHHHDSESSTTTSSSSSSSESDSDDGGMCSKWMEEMERKLSLIHI